jgi:hypothetical protein
MLDNPEMVSIQDSEPVTRFEFRTAMTDIDRRFDEVKGLIEDGKRQAGVLHEDLAHKMDLMIEVVSPLAERVPRCEDRLAAVEADVDLLKSLARSRR